VRAAALELGYRPSAIARSLKLRATRTLGLIVTDIENPFFPQLVRGVEDAARNAGYALLLCNASDDPDREAGYLDLLVDRRVDGIIIAAGSLPPRHADWLARPPLPVVLVNTRAAGPRMPSIVSANRAGGRLAVEHLLALGHRRIGVLTAPARHQDAPDRLAGGRDALASASTGADALVVVTGDAHVGGGERAAAELLAAAPDVTAIATYNDLMAIGAMRTIRSRGGAVPGDVSVVGFDDIDLAAYVEPALTTVAQQTAEMGRRAVATLTELIRQGPSAVNGRWHRVGSRSVTARNVVLDVHLIVRASTAPPRA
jgi:LacI family transcriptional regulator